MVDIIFFGASILQLDFDAQRKVCDFCSTDKEKKGRASVTNLWQMVKNRGCKKKKRNSGRNVCWDSVIRGSSRARPLALGG